MKIRKILACLTPLILVTLACHSDAQILIDEFDDGNDDGWTHISSYLSESLGPPIFDASSQTYQLGSTQQIHDIDSVRNGGFLGATWDASADPLYSDGILRARFNITESATNFGLNFRVADDLTSYEFGATSLSTSLSPTGPGAEGVFLFNKYVGGQNTKNEIVQFGVPKIDEEWIVEGGVVGDRVTMKYWAVGEPEPATPQFEWIDPDPIPAGFIGVSANVDGTGIEATGNPPPWRIGVTVDDIWFTPVPDPSIEWRSEGRFDAATMPRPTAINTFAGESVNDVGLVEVNFEHEIAALDGGELQLNDGNFRIHAANGDVLDGIYTDFRYTPIPDESGMFSGAGSYQFIGGSGLFFGASGNGSWVAEAGFDLGSTSTGFANHDWIGQLILKPNPLPGDIDDNGSVAFADFLLLSESFGTVVDRYTSGDLDGDGSVAFADFLILSSNFGRTSGTAAAVPEPKSYSLVAFAAVGIAVLRRQNRHQRGRPLRSTILAIITNVEPVFLSNVVRAR